MKLTKFIVFVLPFIFLTACGSRMSGTYVSVQPQEAAGMITLEFESGKKALFTVNGVKTEVDYTLDGKNLKLENGGKNQVVTVQDDGSIAMDSGLLGNIVLKKK
jgi:hypothetical protein